jgi:fructokinase
MRRSTERRAVVVGLGELLWDAGADGRRLGGAPANFACHAAQLGAQSWIVSGVGDEPDGAALVREARTSGVETCVAVLPGEATGRVDVVLDVGGDPSYRIAAPSAWDGLPWTDAASSLAARADAVCFGSLAQRSPKSRETIHRFLAAAPDALKLFDVNLRAPFTDRAAVEASLHRADLLKVNEAEWAQLARWFDVTGAFVTAAAELSARFDLRGVLRSRGACGADAVIEGEPIVAEPVAVAAIDTVGAGDAFSAVCCLGLLRGADPRRLLERAARTAEFVCTRRGGAPSLPNTLREQFDAICPSAR